jgi:hypothetical protein
MDIQKSFTFQFDDRNWIGKLGLGTVITIIPVLNLAWTGYMVHILRNVMAGDNNPLPNWGDLWKKLTDGLILFTARVIYSLPVTVFVGLPVAILVRSGAITTHSDLRELAQILGGIEGVIFTCVFIVIVIYSLFFFGLPSGNNHSICAAKNLPVLLPAGRGIQISWEESRSLIHHLDDKYGSWSPGWDRCGFYQYVNRLGSMYWMDGGIGPKSLLHGV